MSRCSSQSSISSMSSRLPVTTQALPLHQPFLPHPSNQRIINQNPLQQQNNRVEQEQPPIVQNQNYNKRFLYENSNERQEEAEDEDEDEDGEVDERSRHQHKEHQKPPEIEKNKKNKRDSFEKEDETVDDYERKSSCSPSSSNTSTNNSSTLKENADNRPELEVETQFPTIPKSSSTIGFPAADEYNNSNGILTPNSTSSSSRSSSSTSNTFMPNYYHQNLGITHPVPPAQTTSCNSTSTSNPFTSLLSQAGLPYHLPPFQPQFYGAPHSQTPFFPNPPMPIPSYTNDGQQTTSNFLYPPTSSMYSTDANSANSFQNLFHQFQHQDYMTNVNHPPSMYYAAAAAAYMSSCYNQQPTE